MRELSLNVRVKPSPETVKDPGRFRITSSTPLPCRNGLLSPTTPDCTVEPTTGAGPTIAVTQAIHRRTAIEADTSRRLIVAP